MKKNSFLYGALLLTGSAILSKILGAVYRIPLTSLISSEGIGIYQLIYPVYSLLFVLSSSGIPLAVNRFISGEIAKKDTSNLKTILKTGLLLAGVFSFICSLIIFFGASFIATVQGNQMATLGFLAISPAIFLGSLVAVFRSYFEGLQNMKPTAISEVIEQTTKVAFGLLFAKLFFDYGLEYGVMGAVLGITLGEVISLISVVIMYLISRKKLKTIFKNKSATLPVENKPFEKKGLFKKIFFQSIPITFGATIVPLTLFVDSILMVNLLSSVGFSSTTATRLFGLQAGIVASLLHLPIIIATSLSTALLPSIVSAKTTNNNKDISFKSTLAVKLVFYIALAAFLGFLMLAPDITNFLYKGGLNNILINETQIAVNLIYIGAISIVYHSLLRIFISLLHAMQKSKTVAKNLAISSVLKIVFTIILVLIPKINIYGAVIASTISYAVASILCLTSLKKDVSFNLTKNELLKAPLIASLLLVVSILAVNFLTSKILSSGFALIVTIGVSALVYLFTLFLAKAFSKEEIKALNFFKSKRQKV